MKGICILITPKRHPMLFGAMLRAVIGGTPIVGILRMGMQAIGLPTERPRKNAASPPRADFTVHASGTDRDALVAEAARRGIDTSELMRHVLCVAMGVPADGDEVKRRYPWRPKTERTAPEPKPMRQTMRQGKPQKAPKATASPVQPSAPAPRPTLPASVAQDRPECTPFSLGRCCISTGCCELRERWVA